MAKTKKIGLVLSGGGFKGVAHIGAIKALEEMGITASHISGTSAGAIVGALYASGATPEEILRLFKKTSLFNISKLTRKKAGFLDSEKFENDLKPFFSENSFEALQKKLFITATNLVEGTTKVFNSGKVIKPLLASAAVPGVFTPIIIDGELYADGGILDNFPIKRLQKKCDLIIGVDVSPLKKPKITDLKTSFSVMQRAYYLRAMPSSEVKFKKCDIIIHPTELVNHGLFSSAGLNKVYDLGYKEAKKQIDLYYTKNHD